jgi:acyl carrier protein
MEVLKEDVLRMVRIQLGKAKVGEADRLMEDLAAESTDFVNLVAAVEEKYHIRVPETEVGEIRTVGDLHAVVDRLSHVAGRRP